MTLLQWPVPATVARPFLDVLRGETELDREGLTNCHFLNPIACYAIHNILVDSKTICTKPLSPLPYCSAEDMYGLDGLFLLKMPDPETDSGEPVNTSCTLFSQVRDGL